MSINWQASAELNKMCVDELKKYFEKYPGSGKKVVAICEGGCGCPDRIVNYQLYRDLCISCSQQKRWEDPKEHKRAGEAQKKSYREDPTRGERQREATNKRYEDPEERKKTGEAIKKCHQDDPTINQRKRESMNKRYVEMEDPGLEIVKHHIAYDFNNPEDLTIEITSRFHGQIHSPKGQPVTERGYSLID